MKQRKDRSTLSITQHSTMSNAAIRPVPWDKSALGINCFEIIEASETALAHAAATPGHYSIKVDPLSSKALLHKHGFYYTDTLIEPFCKSSDVVVFQHPNIKISSIVDINLLLPMCDENFLHGRFHRDFNLPTSKADLRYKQWLKQLADEGNVLGLFYRDALAGFIAHNNGNLLLHTVDTKFRGQGLAKYFWSMSCQQLADDGVDEIRSSISASNLPVLNLYCSLGFRFSKAVDTYHRLTG